MTARTIEALPAWRDTPRLAVCRARGDALLAAMVARVQSDHDLPWPCQLRLVAKSHGVVSVKHDWWRKRGRTGAWRQGHVICCGVDWLESATDAEVMATFAHELGHVVHGDCAVGPKPTHTQRMQDAQDERHEQRVHRVNGAALVLMWIGLSVMGLAGIMSDTAFLLLVLMLVTLAGGTAVAAFLQARDSRKRERAADAFMARYADPAAFIHSLRRWEGKSHALAEWINSKLFRSHPTTTQRAAALGVREPGARQGTRGMIQAYARTSG
jgi:Zn-dependent protease with chaperone function